MFRWQRAAEPRGPMAHHRRAPSAPRLTSASGRTIAQPAGHPHGKKTASWRRTGYEDAPGPKTHVVRQSPRPARLDTSRRPGVRRLMPYSVWGYGLLTPALASSLIVGQYQCAEKTIISVDNARKWIISMKTLPLERARRAENSLGSREIHRHTWPRWPEGVPSRQLDARSWCSARGYARTATVRDGVLVRGYVFRVKCRSLGRCAAADATGPHHH